MPEIVPSTIPIQAWTLPFTAGSRARLRRPMTPKTVATKPSGIGVMQQSSVKMLRYIGDQRGAVVIRNQSAGRVRRARRRLPRELRRQLRRRFVGVRHGRLAMMVWGTLYRGARRVATVIGTRSVSEDEVPLKVALTHAWGSDATASPAKRHRIEDSYAKPAALPSRGAR
jgi:hypothetical protein